MPKRHWDVVIIGGGAAGFFAAINIKEIHPDKEVLIIEKDKEVLKKVKISGGGRCNVTHYCFEAKELVKYYPRGNKELLGPFHSFGPQEMIQWLEYHGIETKVESDNRVFPKSNKSQTIIDCFLQCIRELDIDLKLSTSVNNFSFDVSSDIWTVSTSEGDFTTHKLIIATGSSNRMWQIVEKLGHTIVPPVPSLFTFNIKNPIIRSLPGISMPSAQVQIENTAFEATGPLLITHWGLSGPGILKLSAWAARELNNINYHFNIYVNWINKSVEEALKEINKHKILWAKKRVYGSSVFNIPKRLWVNFLLHASVKEECNWADINKNQISSLAEILVKSKFKVEGKSTFKDEFVTAGGVDLSEINFKTFESKKIKNLFFAGEILNIDGVTGGFNFQAAWTGAWIIAQII